MSERAKPNDKDMSYFIGTQFEGMTYMQVIRRLTPEQRRRLKSLNKQSRRVARYQRDCKAHAATYR